MAKKRAKSDSGQCQLSLLDWMERYRADQAAGSHPVGSLNIEARLRQSLSDGLKQCPLSVHQVAGEMSHLLGETITADMIYSWTAESKSLHQVWGARLPAFCRATGWNQPLIIMTEAAGMFCLPGPEALRAEIQRYTEDERKARSEKRKREIFLQEIEGRI